MIESFPPVNVHPTCYDHSVRRDVASEQDGFRTNYESAFRIRTGGETDVVASRRVVKLMLALTLTAAAAAGIAVLTQNVCHRKLA
jgi:hypothetical protein